MGIMGGIIVSINPNPSGVMLDCGMAATWLDSNTGKNVKSVSGISNDFKQMCMLGNWCSVQYLFYYNSYYFWVFFTQLLCFRTNFWPDLDIFEEKKRLDIAVRMNFRNFSGEAKSTNQPIQPSRRVPFQDQTRACRGPEQVMTGTSAIGEPNAAEYKFRWANGYRHLILYAISLSRLALSFPSSPFVCAPKKKSCPLVNRQCYS